MNVYSLIFPYTYLIGNENMETGAEVRFLLGEKTEGKWKGYVNGFGGRWTANDETFNDLLIEQLAEQTFIRIEPENRPFFHKATLHFKEDCGNLIRNPGADTILYIYTVYVDEVKPEYLSAVPKEVRSRLDWYPSLPFDKMPPCDMLWLPLIFPQLGRIPTRRYFTGRIDIDNIGNVCQIKLKAV